MEQLKEILYEVGISEEIEITENSLLGEDLGVCSFDMMEIIALIESRTGKSVDFTKFTSQLTVRDLLNAIQ